MFPQEREPLDKTRLSLTGCHGPAVRSHGQVLGSCRTDPEKKKWFIFSRLHFSKRTFFFFSFLKTDFVYGPNIPGSGQWAQNLREVLLCSSLLSLCTSRSSVPLKFLLKSIRWKSQACFFFFFLEGSVATEGERTPSLFSFKCCEIA